MISVNIGLYFGLIGSCVGCFFLLLSSLWMPRQIREALRSFAIVILICAGLCFLLGLYEAMIAGGKLNSIGKMGQINGQEIQGDDAKIIEAKNKFPETIAAFSAGKFH